MERKYGAKKETGTKKEKWRIVIKTYEITIKQNRKLRKVETEWRNTRGKKGRRKRKKIMNGLGRKDETIKRKEEGKER